MKKIKKVYGTNPITRMDYPDPDVIRVNNTYYMVSTTMHFFPGCEILRSYDLINWEHYTYVYESIDGTDAQKLNGNNHIYGQGMWAPCIRYHEGNFYIVFSCNDTKKTYVYTANDLKGPWTKGIIEGFYHDSSILFDEGNVYIVYGNTDIHLTQLKPDLSGPLEGGIDRVIIRDIDNPNLGYEGSHIYKHDGRYYIFLIHSLKSEWRRVEAVFSANTLTDEFMGCDVLDDDLGFRNMGIAQGGMVDDGNGNYYMILFQDSGAVGRVPHLVPFEFVDGNVVVKDGKVPMNLETIDIGSEKLSGDSATNSYESLMSNDDFSYLEKLEKNKYNNRLYGCFGLKSCWQFSHEPDLNLINVNDGKLSIKTNKIAVNLFYAKNVLTQRMVYPSCKASVVLDGSKLNDGDFAGLCAYQGDYAFAGIMKEDGKLYKVMCDFYNGDDIWKLSDEPCIIREKIELDKSEIEIRGETVFADEKDECVFYIDDVKIGDVHKLKFRLDHFTGVRYGLFVYSTKQTGGEVAFADFKIWE
ncbi:glycoside hydrolase 43 family protein [Eubacterium sp.]|uniref:glycoside hydrolase family 43 protein n=1 Tax=Eubacterium sp. TaxID=142586 RepID=UPI0025E5CA84|nr:glycoside hydrolase 43 family protein [Eubacterium sp.]MCR5629330.1 glycoside hydrolase 43 family protein [Eubacterium sp.]